MFKFNKFRKLKRDDVVQSLLSLQEQLNQIEEKLRTSDIQIKQLMERGRLEPSREIKLFHAKRVIQMQDEKVEISKRGMYLLYNIKLLSKLKDAIDSQEFIKVSTKASLVDLLTDHKNLANFLNKALNIRIKQEEILTNADTVFNEVSSQYIESEEIYRSSQDEASLIAMFELLPDEDISEDKQSPILEKERSN
jgi:hypothetical protein